MSVNSSTPLSGNQPPAVDTTGIAALPSSPSGTNTVPALHTREPASLTGWRDLPDDVLALLFTSLITEAISVSTPPAARFEALQTLVQLGSVANQEKKLLQTFLQNNQLDLDGIREEILNARREEWKSHAAGLASQRDSLLKDFSVTREALRVSTQSSGLPLALPDSCEGVHLCFREISLTPAMADLVSGLKGKTVKIDATGIGRDRFLAEVLPTLEKLPADCKVVLDAGKNGLMAADLNQLTGLMSRKPVIYRLDLSSNPLSDRGTAPQGFSQLFRQAGPLTHLYLAETGFGTKAASAMKNVMTEAKHLEHLDLRNNQLDDVGVVALIDATLPDARDVSELSRLDALRSVRLAGNPCTDEYEVFAAESRMAARWRGLVAKASVDVPDGGQGNFATDPWREIFELPQLFGTADEEMQIRLHDSTAAASRL